MNIHGLVHTAINDVIKGDADLSDKTVKVVMMGGTLDGITAKTEAIELAEGEKVLLLLAKEPQSIYGDAYYPISVSKSIYKIEDDQAINKMDDRTGDKDEVKKRISDKLQ